jgi:hypothetical protein
MQAFANAYEVKFFLALLFIVLGHLAQSYRLEGNKDN